MRTIIYSFFALAMIAPRLKAQFPNPILFNSASNASGTGTIAMNNNDLNWTVSMTGTAGPFVAAVSADNPYPVNWVSSPYVNANWISFPHTCPPVNGWLTSPAEHSCLNPSNLDVYYRLVFDLPSANCGAAISTPSAYCLSFDFFADNSVYEVLVNGQSSFINTGTNPYYQMGYVQSGGKTISLCNFWQVGSNTVTVHVKSGQGAAPTWEGLLAQVNQTITNVGAPFAPAVTITVTPPTCYGYLNGSATVSVAGSQGQYSFFWIPQGTYGQTAWGLSAGNYALVVSDGLCEITETFSVAQPEPPAFTITPASTRCPGKPVILSAAGAVSYTWQPGNLTGASVTVAPIVTTVYNVFATDASFCIGSKAYTQNVLVCTGVSERRNSAFVITPNPGDGIFSLTGLESGLGVEVIDLTGRLVLVFKTIQGATQIELTGRQPGLYFVRVTTSEGQELKKLVLR